MDQSNAPDPARLEQARKLFAGPCDFIAGAPVLSALPPLTLSEFGFVGRSNVGKSSLVNALTGRKTLARVSHTPGRTQQLNFFNLSGRLMLVDMPGYGFAKVAKSQSAAWNNLIRTYLRGRATLRCVFVLVDSRHGLKDTDLDVMKLLDESAVSYRIVLTKTDDAGPRQTQETKDKIEALLKTHAAAFPQVIATSSHEGAGIEDLRLCVLDLLD